MHSRTLTVWVVLLCSACAVTPEDTLVPARSKGDEHVVLLDGTGARYDAVTPAGSGVRLRDEAAICDTTHRDEHAVYFGTLTPTTVGLSPGQVLAIGRLDVGGGLCTASVIGSRWAITAKHCTRVSAEELTMRVGRDPSNANVRIGVVAEYDHPDLDVSLIELELDPRLLVPELVPLRITTDEATDAWIGSIAEAAGYGQTPQGRLGTRYFTAEPVVAISERAITIDGEGARGVCFGDSGGPLLMRSSDGSVRIVGVLSGGDSSCLGRDNFARLDRARAFVETATGPTPEAEELGCRGFSDEGRCVLGVSVFCGEDDVLHAEVCGDDEVCGWNEDEAAFRCVAPARDTCAGIDNWGVCAGDVARFCKDGELQEIDCGECGLVCAVSAAAGGVTCASDPCADLDYQGECAGDVARWCNDGMYHERDCAESGQTCGWVSETEGFFCK